MLIKWLLKLKPKTEPGPVTPPARNPTHPPVPKHYPAPLPLDAHLTLIDGVTVPTRELVTALNRALNTWEKAPPWVLRLYDRLRAKVQ